MGSESHRDSNFDLHPETWVIDRIVLLASAAAAEEFLRHIYPLSCNCLIASADRVYPHDPRLNEQVFYALENAQRLRVVVFNFESLKTVSVCSDRLFVMDDLILQDFKRQPIEKPAQLHLNATKIAFMIEAFFAQWDKMQRIGNVSFVYKNFNEFCELNEQGLLLTT